VGYGVIPGVIPSHSKNHNQDHGKTSNDGTPHITPAAETDLDFIDIHMLDEELDDLEAESQTHSDAPSHLKRQHSESSEPMDEDENDNLQGDDEDFRPDSDSEDEDNEVSEQDAAVVTSVFNREMLSKIHECINDAIVPTWITCPPQNLGEKSHGKLTADQWSTLFSIFLPMVLPELWLASGKRWDSDLLDNFHDLIMFVHKHYWLIYNIKCCCRQLSSLLHQISPNVQNPIPNSSDPAKSSLRDA
jgi:hypothetical protein